MGHRLRRKLDQLHPTYTPESPTDSTSKLQSFKVGDWVYAHNYAGVALWVPAKVVNITGPHSYRVELEDGWMWRRHIDQLWSQIGTSVHCHSETIQNKNNIPFEQNICATIVSDTYPYNQEVHLSGEPGIQRRVTDETAPEETAAPRATIQKHPLDDQGAATGPTNLTTTETPTELHRSERVTWCPTYLHDYIS